MTNYPFNPFLEMEYSVKIILFFDNNHFFYLKNQPQN